MPARSSMSSGSMRPRELRSYKCSYELMKMITWFELAVGHVILHSRVSNVDFRQNLRDVLTLASVSWRFDYLNSVKETIFLFNLMRRYLLVTIVPFEGVG